MSKKRLTSETENSQILNLDELIRLAESEVASHRAVGEGPFSLSELSKRTRISQQTLLYFEEAGILNPSQAKKVKRIVKEFSKNDFENALFAKKVGSKSNYKPRELALLVKFWRESLTRSLGKDPLYKVPIDLFSRAQLTLLGRLVAIETAMLCGLSDAPKNMIAIVRRLEHYDLKKKNLSPWTTAEISPDKVRDRLISDTVEDTVRGISTATGEMLVSHHETERIQESLDGRKFWEVCLVDYEKQQFFEFTLGFPKGANIHLDSIPKDIFLGAEKFLLFLQLLRYTFSVVLHLNEFIYKATTSLQSRQLDVLHVIAEAIIKFAPEKWDYCGILVPKSSSSILKVVAWSAEFPNSLQGEIVGVVSNEFGPTLPIWVYKNKEAAVINQVLGDDPRILQAEAEQVKAAAAVPAAVGNEVAGVIYIASHKLNKAESLCFENFELKILRIFAQIIGEIIERENGVSRCIQSSLKIVQEQTFTLQRYEALQHDISIVVENIFNSDNNLNSSDYLVVLTIGIDGILEVASRQQETVSWISEKVQEKTHRFLTNELKHDSVDSNSLRIYKLGLDQYVALLYRTKEDHRRLRSDLEKNLATLQGFGTKLDQIKIDVWSLEFKYSDLFQKIKIHKYSQNELTKELSDKIQGSLNVLMNIRQGNKYLNGGRYDLAFWEFETAHRREPANPYVLRHMAHCKIILKQHNDAIAYAEKAVQLDGKYAGSHIVLGDAYIAHGNYEKAAQAYKDAINLNPNHSPLYLGFGQALILGGNSKHIDEALQALSVAMSQDRKDVATITKYLRLMAEACLLVNEFERATRFLDQALGLLPNDRELIFLLRLAESLNFQLNHNKDPRK